MTEPGPVPPPSGAVPPVPPPPPVAPPSSGAPLPPPTGSPIDGPTFSAPPPRPSRPWLIPVIIGGSLLVVALIVGVSVAAFTFATTLAQSSSEPPTDSDPDDDSDATVDGEPGAPIAADPLDCDGCFDIDDARALSLPDSAYADIGLAATDGDDYETTARLDQIDQTKWWKSDGGTPEECYPIYPVAPLFTMPGTPGDSAAGDDPVFYSPWHHNGDEYYYFREAIRVFDDSEAAAAHLHSLEATIAECPTYALPESGWSSRVTAAAALDLPDSVAAYGWVERGGVNRYYGFDLQRGNLVARITLGSDPSGPSEAEYRGVVEAYADALAALDPEG